MATSSLLRVRYAGLDFDTHEDEILARLQVKFATVFNDFAVSSLGIMLIDIFAFGLDTLSFYLDRRATDNFISTARTRASVARLARQLGYKMGASTASAVDLEIRPATAQTFAFTVPVGFQFRGPSGLVFEARESATWSIGETTTKTITASEGETLIATFTSDGSENQVFDIANVPDGKFVLGPGTENISQVSVTVDGEIYEEEELLVFGDTAQFEIGYNDDPPTLRFGDGIAGTTPPDGAEIRVEFFATSGTSGQATASTITDVVTPLVVGFTPVELIVDNPEGTNGGSDPESVESAKANAPSVFKSRGVNITTEDYEARATSFVDPVFGAIAAAQAVTVRGSSSDAYLNSKLADIRSEIDAIEPTVSTAVTTITDSTDRIDGSITDARSDDADISTELSSISTELGNIESANDDSRVSGGVINTSSGGLGTDITNLETAISNAQTAGSVDDLTNGTKTAMDQLIARLRAWNSDILGNASTVTTSAGLISSAMDAIDVSRLNIDTARAGISSDIDDIETEKDLVETTATDLDDDVTQAGLDVDQLTQDIYDHVDSFLSNECKSNLIEVPVLTLDSEGFYVVPTIGLQQSLQSYLEAKKEVTQVVKVTGADNILVEADITVLVGIYTGYNEATVRSQVEAAILDVLRGRPFGKTLRLSELYAPIAPETDDVKIDGVDYVNIAIVGPSGRIDTDGNLPIEEYEVVTRGTITVTSVVVQSSTVVA